MKRTPSRFLVLLLLGVLAGLTRVAALAEDTKPSELRAGAIYQFCQMIKWPAPAANPFVIGVLGKGEITEAVAQLEKQPAGGSPIHVQTFTDVKSITACQVLVVGESEEKDLPAILDAVKGRPVLTVGNFPGFAQRGGCIGFYSDRNRLHFNLNSAAMQRANLTANAHLLSLATVVKGP